MYDYTLQYGTPSSIAVRESADMVNRVRINVLEQSRAEEKRNKDFSTFVYESKKFLLSEAMFQIFRECIPESTDESLVSFGRSVIDSFVNEEAGRYDILINGFKTKSLFLAEFAAILEDSNRAVIHEKPKDGDPTKPPSLPHRIIKGLGDKVKKMDGAKEMTDAIRKRVIAAEEELIKANVEDKENMQQMAEKCKENIDKVRSKSGEDTEKEIKESYAATYRRDIQDKVMSRNRGILESIVYRMSNQIITENSIREQFIKEDGKMDTKRIIEMSEIMYTVLEMVNTTRIKEITPQYLKEALASIK